MSGPPLEPPRADFQQLSYAVTAEKPRMGMAIAALVFGILGAVTCFPLLGIVGLILGIIATLRAGREPQRYGGKGMAIGGICTGAASVVIIFPLIIAILLPSLSDARRMAKQVKGIANLRAVGMAAMVYASDNQHALPPDFQTLIANGSCMPQMLLNPPSGHTSGCDFFYVTGLTSDDPPNWIIAYGDPAHSRGEGAPVVYLSGSAQFLKEKPEGRFTKEIERFKAEFARKRGHPPQMIAPN